MRALDRLLELCRAKGLRPVLLELPLDVRVVGRRLDAARRSYRAGLRRVARRHDAEFVSLRRPVALPTPYYWDLMHLLPPGSRVWQSRLSDALVPLLPRAAPGS